MKPGSSRPGRSGVVTGAGAGLGREIALGLAARGYIVFGTAASSAQAQELKDASGGRVSLTVCDSTRAVAVEAWACGVADALGPAGLDLLISNGERSIRGPVEALPLEAIRQVFDVNVFGALSVINAYLPALRSARGRIVQIVGWAGSMPLAFDGASGASAAALEAFTAVYRAELKPLGVDVTLVQLGVLNTGEPALPDAAPMPALPPRDRKLYGKACQAMAKRFEDLQAAGMEAGSAATRIIDIAQAHPAEARTVLGAGAELEAFIREITGQG